MPYQPISAVVTEEALTEIKEHIEAIRAVLPFLQPLTPKDRQGLYKMRDGRLAFVTKAVEGARQHPEVVPGIFKVEEFVKDFDLTAQLVKVRALVTALASDVDDTTMGTGSEAATAATKFYGYVKDAVATAPGLKPLAEELGKLYERANQTREEAGDAPVK